MEFKPILCNAELHVHNEVRIRGPGTDIIEFEIPPQTPGLEFMKLFFMLSSAEHAISTAPKYIIKIGRKFRLRLAKPLIYPAHKC